MSLCDNYLDGVQWHLTIKEKFLSIFIAGVCKNLRMNAIKIYKMITQTCLIKVNDANNHKALQWFLVQWYQSSWQLVHQLLHYLAPQIQIIAAHKSTSLISFVKHTNIMIGYEFEHRTRDREKGRSSNTIGWVNRKNYLSLEWLCCFLEDGQKFRRLICNSK